MSRTSRGSLRRGRAAGRSQTTAVRAAPRRSLGRSGRGSLGSLGGRSLGRTLSGMRHTLGAGGGTDGRGSSRAPGAAVPQLAGDVFWASFVGSPAGLTSAYGESLKPLECTSTRRRPIPPAALWWCSPAPSSGPSSGPSFGPPDLPGTTVDGPSPAGWPALGGAGDGLLGADPGEALRHHGHRCTDRGQPLGLPPARATGRTARAAPSSRWPAARRRGGRCGAARRGPPAARSGRPWRRRGPGRPRRTWRRPGRWRRRGSGRRPGARTGSAGSGWRP